MMGIIIFLRFLSKSGYFSKNNIISGILSNKLTLMYSFYFILVKFKYTICLTSGFKRETPFSSNWSNMMGKFWIIRTLNILGFTFHCCPTMRNATICFQLLLCCFRWCLLGFMTPPLGSDLIIHWEWLTFDYILS